MSTWGNLRFQLNTASPGLNLDLLDGFLNTRYESVLEACAWSDIHSHFTLVTQPAYQSGTDTVTATLGSTAVVGVGTTWTAALINTRFYIPGNSVFYTVVAVADGLHLTLERPYEGNGIDAAGTVYAASPYVFMQHIYTLPADVSTVVSLLDPVTGFPLNVFSKAQLDASVGPRTQVNDPVAYAVYDDTSEQTPPVLHQIELSPPPLHARGIPVEYVHVGNGFDGGSTSSSPYPFITDSVLLYGCKADIAMHLAGNADTPARASIYLKQASGYEAKFTQELAKLLRTEYVQRRAKTPFKSASRFTRHRLARAGRGLNNYWGPGQGGPN